MNFKRQFTQMLRALLTGISILVFTLSLVLPYSSAYYSKDCRVSQKHPVTLADEKVEVSTNLLSSPAECLNTKIVQRFQSIERAVAAVHPRPIILLLNRIGDRTRFDEAFSIRSLPWRPSIVIALRKLII